MFSNINGTKIHQGRKTDGEKKKKEEKRERELII
jgi:hypothetical protein